MRRTGRSRYPCPEEKIQPPREVLTEPGKSSGKITIGLCGTDLSNTLPTTAESFLDWPTHTAVTGCAISTTLHHLTLDIWYLSLYTSLSLLWRHPPPDPG
ncbi:hypothetical protein TIFTF001_027213 [Ficus carica]|uniref:Uncharacterized protein n=1 Tax=Ficus carica TaxID=3494 RepID=A0AA88DMK8_FICCA|nr:hypothetical protein TIFTF001_027213 [Ficus carica]